MNNFEKEIKQYITDKFPACWTFLWSCEEAEKIPLEHKDQIHFLNEEGTKFINEYLERSKITENIPHHPFKDHFQHIEEFIITENCGDKIKKWLYNKGIPFSRYVFIDRDRSGKAVMLTWKMVIKYWEGLFFAEDLLIFDSSLQWALFYYHENKLYYGSNLQGGRT